MLAPPVVPTVDPRSDRWFWARDPQDQIMGFLENPPTCRLCEADTSMIRPDRTLLCFCSGCHP